MGSGAGVVHLHKSAACDPSCTGDRVEHIDSKLGAYMNLGEFLSSEFQVCVQQTLTEMRSKRILKRIAKHEKTILAHRRQIEKREAEIESEERILKGLRIALAYDIPELYHEIASRHKCSALELYAVVPAKYDADADVIESWAKMFDIGMIT